MDDETHLQRYADAIHAARNAGDDAFQNWFNKSGTVDESLRRGYWDFAFHVLTNEVVGRLSDPGSLTALEIGYGGGRLLNAAACFFGAAIGVDVHGEEAAVAALLAEQGRRNVELFHTEGRTVPVPDESVDFVYSFIVLQHLPSLAVLESYLAEAHRVLRPGGVAQLYYGRLTGRSRLRGYREITDAQVNHVSLALSPRYAARLCRRAGFSVVGRGGSYKNVPDGYPSVRGGQGYVTVVKDRRQRR
jgi:SAM-dependent methyltransferase